MIDLIDTIAKLLNKGEDLVLARVIDVKGSAPREAGASMIIRRNGEIAGTIGGGMIESTAMIKAPEVFMKKGFATLAFDMTDGDITRADMVCGGKLKLFMQYLPATAVTANIYEYIQNNRRRNRTSYLITSLPGSNIASDSIECWLLSDGEVRSFDSKKPVEIAGALKDIACSLNNSSLVQVNNKAYWIDVISSTGVLYIFGAGHVAKELADMAIRVGFDIVVLDKRAEYANPVRFKKPVEVIVLKSFDACFEGLNIDDNSYIVIVTHGHKYDRVVLEQALASGAGYIGMIGSIRKREAVYKALLSEGFTSQQLDKVHCPIGMKIDTETPAEIAVSIVGELIDIRAEKKKLKCKTLQQ